MKTVKQQHEAYQRLRLLNPVGNLIDSAFHRRPSQTNGRTSIRHTSTLVTPKLSGSSLLISKNLLLLVRARARARGHMPGPRVVYRGVMPRLATGERLQDDECRDHGDGKKGVQQRPDVLRIRSIEPTEALGNDVNDADGSIRSNAPIRISGAESESGLRCNGPT